MKLFLIKQNKFNQAKTWIETHQVREDKKQALQAFIAPQEESVTSHFDSYQPQVVFTRVDSEHGLDDVRKIEKIYNELSAVPLAPVLAT